MAIVVLALCGGAPFVPVRRGPGKGKSPLQRRAPSMLLVATIIVLPLAVPPLVRALDTGADVSVWHVAWPMLLFMLLPFVIGIVIRARSLSLTMALGQWLGPVALTFLLVHITLYLSYAWDSFEEIAGYGQMAYSLAFPIVGLVIGYLLCPPYILSPVPAAHKQRGTKVVSMAGVALQNTGAVICCAIFAFGRYEDAGSMMLVGAIVTIIVVFPVMADSAPGLSEARAWPHRFRRPPWSWAICRSCPPTPAVTPLRQLTPLRQVLLLLLLGTRPK